jgi:hypothetical protein
MNAFTLVIYLGLALGIMFGLVKPQRFGRFIVGLIVGPVLTGVAYSVGRDVLLSFPTAQRGAIIVIAFIPVTLLLLRLVLPKDIWAGVVSGFIHDGLKLVFTLPFKLVRSGFRLASRRAIRYR